MGEKVIPVRLGIDTVDQIDSLISAGSYLNRSDFIREAVRFFLKEERRSSSVRTKKGVRGREVLTPVVEKKLSKKPSSLTDDLKSLLKKK